MNHYHNPISIEDSNVIYTNVAFNVSYGVDKMILTILEADITLEQIVMFFFSSPAGQILVGI
ncbi:hypothetical protein PPTG_23726 [Phytophthora nicotianae INRA-310]|uniref:Uncharacterized protein n=1 Tax=Phytophthora nicotianae (strain INRA-310) TaxID=761204 RepID=W2PSL5_PHYN3|nr:hypothetical protein PPTG_23726 [Phytophthora nicotianae INRA-310]ETN03938.1 hypothetical protein PPTG_23726 [Phytophthora nicotianae INRA-310]